MGGCGTGTWPDGFASIGHDITVDLLFEAPPAPPAPYHSFSIVCGAARGFIGRWLNNIGTITDGTYTIPNGSSVDIQQFMIGGSITAGTVRFVIGRNRYPTDQFPTRIVARNGATEIVLMRPDVILEVGQGNGQNYTGDATLHTSVFVNGATVTADLYYD